MTDTLETALATITGSTVLADTDLAAITSMRGELLQTWETAQIFRTRTEMEYSVLNDLKHPTPDAKYWQCVREQNAMFSELVSASYEYRKNDVELRQLQRKLLAEKDDLERELLQIEIDKKLFIAASMRRTAADRVREIRHWHDIKAALLPHLNHGVADVNEHQFESLPIRFERMAQLVTPHTPPADAANLIGLHITAQNRAKAPIELGAS